MKKEGRIPVFADVVQRAAAEREEGYLNAVNEKATLIDGVYYLMPEDWQEIARQFRTKTPAPATKPVEVATKPATKPAATPKPKKKLTPREQAIAQQFFERRGGNLFPGAEKLWEAWDAEVQKAGGDNCPGCVANRLRNQYWERVKLRIEEP